MILGLETFGFRAGDLYDSAADRDSAVMSCDAVLRAFGPADLDSLAGHVIGLAAGSGDGKAAPADETVFDDTGTVEVFASCADTLAAGAGIGNGHGAAGHPEVVVGLDSGCSLILSVFAVIADAAGDLDIVSAVFDKHVVFGDNALLHRRGRADFGRAAGKLHVLLAPDAMAGRGAAGRKLESRAVHDAHIVIGGDARLLFLVFRLDRESAAAGEDELAFGEEDCLHVGVGIGGISR